MMSAPLGQATLMPAELPGLPALHAVPDTLNTTASKVQS